MGGKVKGTAIDRCMVFCLRSKIVETITCLDQPRQYHTVHHTSKAVQAYVIGGKNDDGFI